MLGVLRFNQRGHALKMCTCTAVNFWFRVKVGRNLLQRGMVISLGADRSNLISILSMVRSPLWLRQWHRTQQAVIALDVEHHPTYT